jgi:hypothetical protein
MNIRIFFWLENEYRIYIFSKFSEGKIFCVWFGDNTQRIDIRSIKVSLFRFSILLVVGIGVNWKYGLLYYLRSEDQKNDVDQQH